MQKRVEDSQVEQIFLVHPELCIETESQRAEWEAAQRRKAMHIQRKREGF